MLKTDVNIIKKGLKRINIKKVESFYVKDTVIIKNNKLNLNKLGLDFCSALVQSIKKSLTGGNSKLFDLELKTDSIKDKLKQINETGDIQEFIENNKDYLKYGQDVIINVINFDILQSTKKKDNQEEDEENNTESFIKHDMFIFIIHTADQLKEFGYSIQENNFSEISSNNLKDIDVVIKFDKPLESFLYPIIEEERINTNKILYFTSKPNKINANITKNLLRCDFILPPKEERILFNGIISETFQTINTETLFKIYQEIYNRKSEDNETINTKELQSILNKQKEENSFEISNYIDDLYGVDFYEFKILNIVPDFTKKSVNIKNNDVNIKVPPTSLHSLKSVEDEDGNTFVMIKIEQDLIIDDLDVKTKK